MITQVSQYHPLILSGLLELLIPLAGLLILICSPKSITRWSGHIFSLCLGLMSLISIYLFIRQWNGEPVYWSMPWFNIGPMRAFSVGILMNRETSLMLCIVSFIALLVGTYSIGYMKDDLGYKRYFSTLFLFTFSMLGIVLGNNLLIIFVFWELVGLSSYLLINHWFENPRANSASKKAFIVNRIGDAGFIIGIAIAWSHFGTLDLHELSSRMSQSVLVHGSWVFQQHHIPSVWLTIMGVMFFLGAVGKSAQFPLQVWLPDAMAGPTPISALIHAATMVAAGVFLLARVFPLLSEHALTCMAFIGAITAFMGAVAALTQFDIKKVLAYSTISQLGYMVMGMGVGAYDASLFHLFTHAFFKAGLFLAAGSVIYALHGLSKRTGEDFDHQDMRNMGGLRKVLPFTFWSYVILSLALVGIPFFSGFLSKDAILSGSFAWAEKLSGSTFSLYHMIPYLALFSVSLTAYYMARQCYLVFLGNESRVTLDEGIKDPEPVMKYVVVLLALMSIGIIWSFNPLNTYESWFFTNLTVPVIVTPGFPDDLQPALVVLTARNHLVTSILSMIMITIGLVVAYVKFRKVTDHSTLPKPVSFVGKLSYSNWGLDRLYSFSVIAPVIYLSKASSFIDRKVVDGLIDRVAVFHVVIAVFVGWFDKHIVDGMVKGIVRIIRFTGGLVGNTREGNVQRYIMVAILLMILLFWLII